MNTSYYKNCMVPQCKSTTIKTPNKLFIYVPNNKQVRKKWLKLAGRDDVHSLSTKSRMYFCADHFDLPNDMVNYTEYQIMGTVSQVRTKPGCIPTKFECQENGRKQTCNSTEQPSILKKKITTDCLNKQAKTCTHSSSLKDPSEISVAQIDGAKVPEVISVQKADKYVQTCFKTKFRSKAIQVKVESIDKASSPINFTSPVKVEITIKQETFD